MAIYLAEELTWRIYADELEMHDLVLEVAGTALVTILIVLAWRRLAPQHARNAISHLTRSGIAIILMAFTSAFVCGFCFWTGWANDAERLPAILEQDVTIELDLIGDPARRDYGYVSNAQMGDGPDAIRVRVIWPKDNEGLFAGHRIAVTGSVSVPKPDDSGRWNHQNGFAGTLRAMNVEELGCSAGLRGLVTSFRDESFEHIAALGGDAAGLLAGVLLGNKTIYADSELEQAFQTTGLAHLMAVSGTHLAIVTMLLSAVLARTPLRRGVRSAMLVAALVVYVAITGFAASAIRACTMCSVADELVACLAGGVDGDDEGVNMARGLARRKAEVGQVTRIVIRLEALEARDLLHLLLRDVEWPTGLVIVHESAEAHAKRTRDLDKGCKRRREFTVFETLDGLDIALAAIRQVLLRKMMCLAQRRDLRSQFALDCLFAHCLSPYH